jgi:hypothetical protein
MRFFLFLTIFSLSMVTSVLSHSSDVPYIYYFSSLDNGLIIERADGTDSRLFPDVPFGHLNWSPSGRWFLSDQMQLLSTDGSRAFELPFQDAFTNFSAWSPSDDWLFIVRFYPYEIRAWIFDPLGSTVLAQGVIPIRDEVTTFEGRAAWASDGMYATVAHYDSRLTLYPDGRMQQNILAEPLPHLSPTWSDSLEGSIALPSSLIPPSVTVETYDAFPSPSGMLFGLLSLPPVIIDNAGTIIRQTIPHSASVGVRHFPARYRWHDDSRWAFVYYSINIAGGGGYVPAPVIFDIAGTMRRELPIADFDIEAGFLPDRAVMHLRAGQSTSMKRDPRFTHPQTGIVASVAWHPSDSATMSH